MKRFFKFDKAMKYMLNGFKVKHKNWNKFDYIFIENGKIYCDGGFEYSNYISKRLLTSRYWQLSKIPEREFKKIKI